MTPFLTPDLELCRILVVDDEASNVERSLRGRVFVELGLTEDDPVQLADGLKLLEGDPTLKALRAREQLTASPAVLRIHAEGYAAPIGRSQAGRPSALHTVPFSVTLGSGGMSGWTTQSSNRCLQPSRDW